MDVAETHSRDEGTTSGVDEAESLVEPFFAGDGPPARFVLGWISATLAIPLPEPRSISGIAHTALVCP
jgi:hypothetical protein